MQREDKVTQRQDAFLLKKREMLIALQEVYIYTYINIFYGLDFERIKFSK